MTPLDRLWRVCLSRVWSGWRSALAIVQPETVMAWHRAGFRLFWTWKVRRGQPRRPRLAREVRDLIRRMSRDNPGRGAPRNHGELLKLGIQIGETSVGKYMVRFEYYHESRTHLSLGKDSTEPRPIQPVAMGRVVAVPQVGGLHHRYERRAA